MENDVDLHYNKFTSALEKSKIDLVPKTVISMGSEKGGSAANAFELLLGLLINERLGLEEDPAEGKVQSEEVKQIKSSILATLKQPAGLSQAASTREEE